MGQYQFLDGQTDDSTGIKRTADNAILPPLTSNGAWRDYLVWKAVPNTPDAATALSLLQAQKAKKASFDLQACAEFAKDFRLQAFPASECAVALGLLLDELYRYEFETVILAALALTPNVANYPLMNALIGSEGATLALVAAAIRTWFNTVKARNGTVFRALWDGHKTVNGLASVASVNAQASPTWPGGGAGE